MRNFTHTIVFSLILLLFTQSCISYKEVEFSEVQDYSFDPSGKEASLKLDFKVNNPNSFGFKLKKSVLDIDLNNKKVTTLKMKEPLKIKRKSNETYQIHLVGDRDALMNSLMKNVGFGLLSNNLELGIKGKIKVTAFFFFWKKIKFEEKQKIDASKLMSK